MGTGDIERLRQHFRRIFSDAGPPAVCRAPGRVNLLGEHLDYNHLPVLPMTLDRHVADAFAPLPHSVVRLHNLDPDFEDSEFVNSDEYDGSRPGHWANYCQAAVHTLNNHFGVTHYPGMAAVVDGDIPPAAGLSSSAALTVAFALAYLRILHKRLDEDISRRELATLLAEAERLVGVPSGGMDQAMALLGRSDRASKIDFAPLRMEEVPLLRGYSFVVCNSLVPAEKSRDARSGYSEGPTLCRLITALLERQLRDEIDPDIEVHFLADLWYGDLCLTHDEATELLERVFPADDIPLAEIASRLGTSPSALQREWLNGVSAGRDRLPLKRRARHQQTEYRRVEEGRDALLAKDAEYFGQLMVQSHESCSKDYEVSSADLNELVEAALDAGAVGARLTGAGFGGCTVNLVREQDVANFVRQMRDGYYRIRYEGKPPPDAVFVAEPAAAADYC